MEAPSPSPTLISVCCKLYHGFQSLPQPTSPVSFISHRENRQSLAGADGRAVNKYMFNYSLFFMYFQDKQVIFIILLFLYNIVNQLSFVTDPLQ